MPPSLSDADYAHLLDLRTGLRLFLHWSEEQAAQVGLTGPQHQLLLCIRGHSDPRGPTIGEVAEYLVRRSHTVVSLVDRVEALGLIERNVDPSDLRLARLVMTKSGSECLESLSAAHLEELSRLGTRMAPLWKGLAPEGG
ncbi:MAG: MarR family winged helix-turn-helix transcriptional regulator [Acidimicrobiales bacterium]